MSVGNAEPSVPLLRDGVLDIEELVGTHLRTFIPVQELVRGDFIFPSFLGRAADGTAWDYVTPVAYQPELAGPDGFPIVLAAANIVALNGGEAFYSFFRKRDDDMTESRRIYFQIGVRPVALQAPSISQAHDHHLDPEELGSTVTVTFAPYKAMAIGDSVELLWQGIKEDGSPGGTYRRPVQVNEGNIGRPLTWEVTQANWITLGNGSIELSCTVTFAEGHVASHTRTLSLSATSTPLLPPATVKGLTGTELDPGAWPEGIELHATLYPGARVGDELFFYWVGVRSSDSIVLFTQLDASSLEKGFIAVHLPYQWLEANNGRLVALHYQFARATASGSSEPLRLTIRKPLVLEAPSVERATPDGSGMVLEAEHAVAGAVVVIPEAPELGPDDTFEAIWEGHGETGSFSGSQMEPGLGLRIRVPPAAIPANMGLTVKVYYKVTQPGMEPVYSDRLMLRILPLPIEAFRKIDCLDAVTGNPPQLYVSTLGPLGARLKQVRWAFIAAGQLLRISATSGSYTEVVRDWVAVSLEESQNPEGFNTHLSKAFLQSLNNRARVILHVAVKFDVDEQIVPVDFPTYEMEIIK
jgi:hypothetical protein